ncbi:unnamed protein product [Chilo suppressalis]|uniref:Uncharacterized protein n=1 Tax=Chilo suppressalis TaxID=168631 RepID=A0ABN8BC32_CHISP|nr:unnamed protein product [Chilo suppressalis]
MIAVVRGLRDSGLTVTLLDGAKQYTLMPNDGLPQSLNASLKHDVTSQQTYVQDSEQPARSDSAAQATDGRYASTYKMAHCRISPTSPPVQLTEFPPQRAEIRRGQTNFEVGGNGSGESYIPCKSNGTFRGGMCWPDRGSVFSPRPSREPVDAFANSLRKYPSISAERSTEIVERLINYTQAKHSARSYHSRNSSPSREVEHNASSQYASGFSINQGSNLEESPTRDVRLQNRYKESDYADKRAMNPNAKYAMDDTKGITNNAQTTTSRVHKQPVYYQAGEGYDPTFYPQKPSSILTAANSVNMEVQAAVEMVSREVAVVPKTQTTKRTVAVPLSPATSNIDHKQKATTFITNYVTTNLYRDEKENNRLCFENEEIESERCSRSFKAIQTSFSSLDLVSKKKCSACYRKIKSQENIRAKRDISNDLIEWLMDVYSYEVSSKFWNERMKKLARKLAKPEGEAKIRDKIQRYLDQESRADYDDERRKFREQLPDNIINQLKKCLRGGKKNNSSPIRIYRIEIPTSDESNGNRNNLKPVIDNWLNRVPIRSRDFLNRSIKREDIVNYLIEKLEPYLSNFQDLEKDDNKANLVNIAKNLLMEIPIRGNDKYLDKLAYSLVDSLFATDNLTCNHTKFKVSKSNVEVKPITLQSLMLKQLTYILEKISVYVDSKRLNLLEEELVDILMDITEFKSDTIAYIQKNIHYILFHLGGLNEYQAKYFSNKYIIQLENDIHSNKYKNGTEKDNKRSQSSYSETYSVFHNQYTPVANVEKQTSIVGQINEDIYNDDCDRKSIIMEQVGAWLEETSSGALLFPNKDLQYQVVKNLTEDIIDRFKYLEINPVSSYDNEVQYLKYQIFKWISKVAMEDNLEIIDRAPDLMKRLEAINVLRLGNSDEINIDLILSLHKNDFSRSPVVCKIDCLLRATVNWLDEVLKIPKDVRIKLAEKLIYTIQIGILQNDLDCILNDEIPKWLKTICKEGQEDHNVEKLKETLRSIIIHQNKEFRDFKRERRKLLIYEDVIEDWLDNCLLDINLLSARERKELTYKLAVKLSNAQYLTKGKSEQDLINYMKQFVSEWTTKVLSQINQEANISDQSIVELVHSILDCNLIDENGLGHTIDSNLASHLSRIKTDDETFQITGNILDTTEKYTGEKKPDDFQIYLQELNLYKCNSSDPQNIIDKNYKNTSNVTVYGFTLPSNSKEKVDHLQDDSIEPITEADVANNHELYFKHIVKEIDEWLNDLQILQVHDKGFREIVVNDLAGDIIDRHKYLELNPSCKGTENNEIDQLRYQIFKWINKLVGEDHQETLDHAPDLMDRIRSVPVPLFTRPDYKNKLHAKEFINSNGQLSDEYKGKSSSSNVRLSNPLEITTEPTVSGNKQNINSISSYGLERSCSVSKKSHKLAPDKSCNETHGLKISDTSVKFTQCNTLIEELGSLPEGMSLPELYKYYDKIFKDRIDDLPFETHTKDQENLAHLARVGIYNGIWKTFYTLSEEPEIANDYCLFELLFEERIDKMLDCLPQTVEMQRVRTGWKSRLLNDLLLLLKYIHSITDKPNIRDIILNKVDRKMMRSMLVSNSDKAQHCFVAKTVDDYIISTRYKDDDPIRANVYRQQLMKRLEELAENVKLQNKVEFYEINPAQLCQIAFKILGDVPIPNKDELKEKAEEILLGEEIEQWYKELPVKPVVNEYNEYLRKRLREILAKRLHHIEKKIDALGDPSLELERDLKHEISKYLEKDADLKEVNDLKVNFMVEELSKRIKNRREHNTLRYDVFEKENVASSTFVQTNPGEIMAPLVDVHPNFNHRSGKNDFLDPNKNFTGRPRSYSLPSNDISGARPNSQNLSYPTPYYLDRRTEPTLSPAFQPENTATREYFPKYKFGSALEFSRTLGSNEQSIMQNNPLSNAPQQIKRDQANFLSPGYFTQGPSTRFMTNSSTGVTQPTERIRAGATTSSEPQVQGHVDGNMQNEEEKVKYKCHCMNQLPKCSRAHKLCDDSMDYLPCYPPMPFPRCFY